jgi:primosomal protein N' (replication factor Y)
MKSTTQKNKKSNSLLFTLYFRSTTQTTTSRTTTKSTTQQIVIIVPEVHHIGDTLSLLDEQHAKHATTWHSGLSTKEQFERWLQVRNGEKRIVIGTRGAILLPYYNLGKIVIDYEQYANHKHWDQAPRFHVKDIAELLRTSQGTEVTLMSYAPSVETYFRIHKGQYTSPSMDIEATPGCTVVNLSHEQKAGNYSPISDTLAQALSTLKGNAFLHLNRLGIATYIGCNECGWRALCPQCTLPQILHTKNKQLTCHYCNITSPLPQICPKCKAHIVTLGALGQRPSRII